MSDPSYPTPGNPFLSSAPIDFTSSAAPKTAIAKDVSSITSILTLRSFVHLTVTLPASSPSSTSTTEAMAGSTVYQTTVVTITPGPSIAPLAAGKISKAATIGLVAGGLVDAIIIAVVVVLWWRVKLRRSRILSEGTRPPLSTVTKKPKELVYSRPIDNSQSYQSSQISPQVSVPPQSHAYPSHPGHMPQPATQYGDFNGQFPNSPHPNMSSQPAGGAGWTHGHTYEQAPSNDQGWYDGLRPGQNDAELFEYLRSRAAGQSSPEARIV